MEGFLLSPPFIVCRPVAFGALFGRYVFLLLLLRLMLHSVKGSDEWPNGLGLTGSEVPVNCSR